jgi:cytochrome P450
MIPYTRVFASGYSHTKLHELHQRYGNVVRISPSEVSVVGDNVWDELMGHRKQGEPENAKDPLVFALTKGSVISANRENHARLRRTLSHGFSAATIEQQQPIINSYVDLLIQKLHERADGGKKSIEMTSWYNWVTFDIIGDLAFGESFGCLDNGEYHPWVHNIFQRIRGNAQNVLASRWGWMEKIVRGLMDNDSKAGYDMHPKLVDERVKKREQMETPRPDFFDTMSNGKRVSRVSYSTSTALLT